MPHTFWGRVLRVNLSTGQTRVDEYDWKWYRKYLGGWNLVAYTLLREVPGDVDPLGPKNPLIFAAGLLTGIPMGTSGRNAVGARSPLTGGFGESDVGGFWGAELRRAGWDHTSGAPLDWKLHALGLDWVVQQRRGEEV